MERPDSVLTRPVFSHKLTEQELSMLTPAQQALAKDWSLINVKTDWLISEIIEILRFQQRVAQQQSQQGEELRLLRITLKIVGWFIPSGIVMLGAIAWLVKYIKAVW